MAIKYAYFIYLGLFLTIICGILFFIFQRKKDKYSKGYKAAYLDELLEDKYYKRKQIEYLILRSILMMLILVMLMSCFTILSKPYRIKKTKENQYNRDIMLCLDVSTSVFDLDKKLVKELQDTVRKLQGERVGIVIFNTSPILLSPLTDDYEYTIEQLENIGKAIDIYKSSSTKVTEDWFYWNNFLMGGTLVGNTERGSSLVSDGLLGAVFNFSNMEKKRTRIVILATDNDVYGTPHMSLSDAADMCKKNNITVFGIGTENMFKEDKNEMENAVIKTGGKFYLEENVNTFRDIVKDIEATSADLVKGKTIISEIDEPFFAYGVLIFSFLLFIVISLLLLRGSLVFAIRQLITGLLLIMLLVLYIFPCKNVANSENKKFKYSSNLNVLFVVDNTISMLALDGADGNNRLTMAKDDMLRIVDDLEGARFSIISFNNDASILSPYTNNSEHIKNVINAIYPIEDLYAKGSSMNIPKKVVGQILKSQVDKDINNVIFFISDGEITDSSKLESYSEFAQYINSGAVLGYGSEDGAIMVIKNSYDSETQIITDPTDYSDAISKMDEDNLKNIAADMNIKYIHMNGYNDLLEVMSDIKGKMEVDYTIEENGNQDVIMNKKDNIFVYLLFPIILMVLIETAFICKKR